MSWIVVDSSNFDVPVIDALFLIALSETTFSTIVLVFLKQRIFSYMKAWKKQKTIVAA